MTELRKNKFGWRLGGAQGSGIEKISTLFALACATLGQHVISRREYHSNIIGRHSYYDIAVGPEPINSHQEHPNLLLALDAESLSRHIFNVTDNGVIFYNEEDASVELTRLAFLDKRLQQDLLMELEQVGQNTDINGLLHIVRQRGVQTLPIPYREMLTRLSSELSIKPQRAARMINTLTVATSSFLVDMPKTVLKAALENIFNGQAEVIRWNKRAIDIAYEYASEHLTQCGYVIGSEQLPVNKPVLFLNGCQSVALGKLAGGVGLQTYYPISPATDESAYLESHSRIPIGDGNEVSPMVIQVEDELAAITMACGAALTGARCATSTSGPGFSLMAEGLGWAGMSEVPLVVSHYQRGGPSTGMPTRTGQADLQFTIHAGHGEFPRIVIASGDIEECFHDTVQAFDYAERFQMPVIHLLDKALTSTYQTLPQFDISTIKINSGKTYTPATVETDYRRFEFTDDGISPRCVLGQHYGQHWVTGVEHNNEGQVSEDPLNREQMMEKRARKLQQVVQELPTDEKLRVYGDSDAAFTLLSWGSNKGAILEALQRLKQKKISTRYVQLRLLWPFPTKELISILKTANPLVTIECNYSAQLDCVLREHTPHRSDFIILKYSGRPMSGEALDDALQQVHCGKADRRIVLRNRYE